MNLDWTKISQELLRLLIEIIIGGSVGYFLYRLQINREREKLRLEWENEKKAKFNMPRALELIDKIQKWRIEGQRVLARSHIEPHVVPLLPVEEVIEIINEWDNGQLEVLEACKALDKINHETNPFNSLFALVNVEIMSIHSKLNDFFMEYYHYLDSGERLPYQPNAKQLVNAKIDEISSRILGS
ncbi:MAG: hypothetical protein AB1894_15880 [Chloroflexota bacterium]